MTADEALGYGLIDRVISSREAAVADGGPAPAPPAAEADTEETSE